MIKYLSIFLLIIVFLPSCKKDNGGLDVTPPQIVSVTPQDGSVNIPVSTILEIEFNEDIALIGTYNITVNGIKKQATAIAKKLTIQTSFSGNTNYIVNISSNSVKDLAGNFIPAFSFSFTTENNGSMQYEAEDAYLSSGLSIQNNITGFTGSGYAGNFTAATDSLVFSLNNITKGSYDLYISYSTSNWGAKVCNVLINGSGGNTNLASSPRFSELKYGKVKLAQGNNKIKIIPNYTYFAIDYIKLLPNIDPVTPFNIAPNLVTTTPSTQAVNLYNYLKNNFQTKIVAGTMANYSTNIDEATWVHTNTGKWPALTCFDFIDNTNLGQSWIKYENPFNLGKDWWANNGIVALMWHWRDPLTKSGGFYSPASGTPSTNFDISKVTDVNSAEYKAIIVDIDTIAGFLKEFNKANIPVIWRPMHEAAGKWFWWGAKGAAPCKVLWKLMFDRLVNYHKLNNLIWVWTTNTDADALDWYPGDTYVDIIGMDLYPGKNQHGSAYAQFDKAKEIFGAKKLLTLSECDAAPDPKLMMEYGDTWSYFMPWNSDMTESSEYNGVFWWTKYFSYDYVITRDKMPSLK